MKRILLILSVILAFSAFAGQKNLKDGTSVYWDDSTTTINYNSYRVTVHLTKATNQNVFGSVILYDCNGKRAGDKNLFISAGEKSANVDFDGLNNGVRYQIQVTINNQ